MLDQLNLSSDHNVDKIVPSAANGEFENTITIVNSGATNQSPQTAFIVNATAPNPYGKPTFVRGRWSVDGGQNWQSIRSRLTYPFRLTVNPPGFFTDLTGLQAAISIGVNKDVVKFITANGYHGDVLDNGVYNYTPISQTFIIEYTLFEVE